MKIGDEIKVSQWNCATGKEQEVECKVVAFDGTVEPNERSQGRCILAEIIQGDHTCLETRRDAEKVSEEADYWKYNPSFVKENAFYLWISEESIIKSLSNKRITRRYV